MLPGLSDSPQSSWQGGGGVRCFPGTSASPGSQGGPRSPLGGLGWVAVSIQITSQTESTFKVHFPPNVYISMRESAVSFETEP